MISIVLCINKQVFEDALHPLRSLLPEQQADCNSNSQFRGGIPIILLKLEFLLTSLKTKSPYSQTFRFHNNNMHIISNTTKSPVSALLLSFFSNHSFHLCSIHTLMAASVPDSFSHSLFHSKSTIPSLSQFKSLFFNSNTSLYAHSFALIIRMDLEESLNVHTILFANVHAKQLVDLGFLAPIVQLSLSYN